MNRISRRQFVAALPGLGLSSLLPPGALARAGAARLVVVGGGFGGATAARFARRLVPSMSVILVEPNQQFVACPFSNLVVSGLRKLEQQLFSYAALSREGIEVAQDTAVSVDSVGRTVGLAGGSSLPYDRLILAPGIDFRWGAPEGYDELAVQRMPHAWKAGQQTILLRDQLRSMKDGGVVALSIPAAPFRCPPGPYERASLIAAYLSRHKPRSRLILLDNNERFSKQPLFQRAWRDNYGDVLEWRSASNDGPVRRVDPAAMRLHTDFEDIEAAVANIIPPQQAGLIARRCGAADATGWCPIDAVTFESLLLPGIHVIGDATIAAPMPKSAFSANAQAKVCAIQVARLLAGLDPEPTTLANTCYSYVSAHEAISVAGVYSSAGGKFTSVPGAGGISPLPAAGDLRQREAEHARDWFAAITAETFL